MDRIGVGLVGTGFMGMGVDMSEMAGTAPKPPVDNKEPAIEFTTLTKEMNAFFGIGSSRLTLPRFEMNRLPTPRRCRAGS